MFKHWFNHNHKVVFFFGFFCCTVSQMKCELLSILCHPSPERQSGVPIPSAFSKAFLGRVIISAQQHGTVGILTLRSSHWSSSKFKTIISMMNCCTGQIPESFGTRQGHSNRAKLREVVLDGECIWRGGALTITNMLMDWLGLCWGWVFFKRHALAWWPLGQCSVKKFQEPGWCLLIDVNKAKKSAPQFICKALNIIDIMSAYYPGGTELYLIKHLEMLGPCSGRDEKGDRNKGGSIDAL